ncbi:MAG: Snf7 family protein [Nitrososphaeria archaeon]|jgi:division protein CdvB (Snf7/Vps24/ESCRT-III family)
MSNFGEKWVREQKPGMGDKVKEAIRPSGPLKPRLEDAVRAIQTQVARLDATCTKLKERDAAIFNKVVTAIQKHDTQHASVYANELAEVRKMNKMVTSSRLALEQIVLRLNTVTELGDIVVTLAPAMSVIRSVKTGIISVLPEAEREINEISGLLSSILVDAGQTSGASLNFEAANEDAEKILAEASAVAEQRMKERFPELPTGVPTAESAFT